jgi:hypothetical protein
MVLNGDTTLGHHPFRYARVIGIYHVNAIYIGKGMLNYEPHRMEFLWVRWYANTDTIHMDWTSKQLDRLHFLPMAEADAFGFIDPSDVLRACYIAPAFAKGKLHSDGIGLSMCARDSQDWLQYFVIR